MLHNSKTIYFETGSYNPFYNLAFEEYIFLNFTKDNYLILWQNDNTIVVGRNQNTDEEINKEFVLSHHINVVRRSTGGGAVYHDLGNLNYSFIADLECKNQALSDNFVYPIITALAQLGIEAVASGRNDILVNGCKVSGVAQRISNNRILHHGTLLFDSDLDSISNALNVDKSKFISKSVKSVKSRVCNIRPLLKIDMNTDDFKDHIKTVLLENSFEVGSLDTEAYLQIKNLETQKYNTWEWNYGASPKCNFIVKRRYAGGILSIYADIHGGTINDISLKGDFLSSRDLLPFTTALKGCRFNISCVEKVLDTFPIADYFGSISKAQIIDALFISHND